MCGRWDAMQMVKPCDHMKCLESVGKVTDVSSGASMRHPCVMWMGQVR